MQLTTRRNDRGFVIAEFTDRSDVACNMQESSLATEAAIWFGCRDPDPKHMVPGQGWLPVQLPANTLCNSRMHLTQDMVRQLLPALQYFADHGSLPLPDDAADTPTFAGLTSVISFIEGFEGDEVQEGIPELLATARKADELLHRNLDQWESEEESVQEEHHELIKELRSFLEGD